MKRYCNLFFLLLSLLFFRNVAECASLGGPVDTSHLNITQAAPPTSKGSSMKEKKPHNEYVVILFRNGIEGKSILFSYKANVQLSCISGRFMDEALTNPAQVKYILSFFDFLALPPEFLSAFSLHAPPILC